MFSYSYSSNIKADNTTNLTQMERSSKIIEEAILSPRGYSSSSLSSSSSSLVSSHKKTNSSDSYAQLNPQLYEKGTNVASNEISHSRFPHTSPSNKIKTDGISYYYLPDNSFNKKKKTLVLDLDDTLVYSSFKKPFSKPDFTMTIEYNNQYFPIFVSKRPFLTDFLKEMAKKFELVIFSASIPKYGNIVIDALDPKKLISHRLYREHCTKTNNNVYAKELKRLGRDLKSVIILDNNPASYMLNKDNALPIKPWLGDKTDTELLKIGRVLDYLAEIDDVRSIIQRIVDRHNKIDYNAVERIIIDKVKNQPIECMGNTMTHQLNNSYNERQAKSQIQYSKIEYPSFINNSLIKNKCSIVNKNKRKIDEIWNEVNTKRQYDKTNNWSIMQSQHSQMNKSHEIEKWSHHTLNQITQLRKEIEHTKKYFS